MIRPLFLILTVFFSIVSFGQGKNYWTAAKADTFTPDALFERSSTPSKYLLYSLDFERFKTALNSVTVSEDQLFQSDVILTLPLADGTFEDFQFADYAVMHPDLQKQYPEIRSFKGVSLQDKSKVIYTTVNIFGVHSMLHTAGKPIEYMDTYTKDLSTYVVYSRNDIENVNSFECHLSTDDVPEDSIQERSEQHRASSQVFRTYRIAISTTIEYSNFHRNAAGVSPSASDAVKRSAVLAAIVTSMTRINSVYNSELSIHLQLIPNNNILINITSDLFNNNNGYTLLGQNQTFIDSKIAWDAYDIGHVFSTGGGGVAILGSVCSGEKAQGVTGSGQPINDPFVIDYVAHEIGHQFGATHTFNGLGQSCTNSTRTIITAVEPGSGSTIMAYAGICNPVNVQYNSDAYFSMESLRQIESFVTGDGACSVDTAIVNTAPTIKPLKNYYIPKSTAFVLEGIATDLENDPLTYCWEQNNNNSSTQPPVSTSVLGPNFRSRMPVSSPKRYFPPLSDVVQNNLSPEYEVVPSVARSMSFKLTVRDNNSVRSQSDFASMGIQFVNVEPFVVQSPNSVVTWAAGSNQTVTWNHGSTVGGNVNCKFVDIYLSTNGGQSFDTLLASKVPNDGSEVVTVPNTIGSANRIMVKGNNHIFYDVSNTNFTIAAPNTATYSVRFSGKDGEQNINICNGANAVFPVIYEHVGNFSGTTTFAVTGNPAGTSVNLSQTSASSNSNVSVTVSNLSNLAVGVYPMQFTAMSGSTTKRINFYLEITSATFAPIQNQTPANNSTVLETNPILTWSADPTVSGFSYNIQVATDVNFATIVSNETVYTNSFLTNGLVDGQEYFWRVATKNEGGCLHSFTNPTKFLVQTLGVDSHDLKEVTFDVFPNPNQGVFTVALNHTNSNELKIAVYDLQGRNIYEQNTVANGTIKQEINISHASAGIYLIRVQDGNQQYVKKIVVK